MGKKRVATKTKDEVLKERDRVEAAVKRQIKLKSSQLDREGRIYIYSSYNNTILTLTDKKGDVLYWVSAGNIGFKNTKKGTPFAASKVAEAMAQVVKRLKMTGVKVFIKGIGSGRDSALRSLAARDVDIVSVKDMTPVPHNGCRPKKPRRM